MNDPIDILEIAANRYAKALEWWHCAGLMNHSAQSVVMHAQARASLDVARADLAATERLVRELAVIDLHNRG